jgi:hypothetical protein
VIGGFEKGPDIPLFEAVSDRQRDRPADGSERGADQAQAIEAMTGIAPVEAEGRAHEALGGTSQGQRRAHALATG